MTSQLLTYTRTLGVDCPACGLPITGRFTAVFDPAYADVSRIPPEDHADPFVASRVTISAAELTGAQIVHDCMPAVLRGMAT